jgi:hypothetical protein
MEPYSGRGVWALGAASMEAACFCVDSNHREQCVATLVQRRGWTVVKREQKPDRERARAIKSRQRAIGRELRRVYDNIAQEPVPDDFLDLLQKIDQADKGGKS